MVLTATIKDTGDDVTCVCDDNGERQTFRVSLKDFLESITAANAGKVDYYEPVGSIPEEVVSLRYARNCSHFSARVVVERKAGVCFFNYGGKIFKIPMPALLFDLHIKEEMVVTSMSKIYALNSKQEVCAYPYTNVYGDCHICWGSLKIPKVKSVEGGARILDFFLAAENNSDLLNAYTKSCLGASCIHELLNRLKKETEFKDEWLMPLNVSIEDIIG